MRHASVLLLAALCAPPLAAQPLAQQGGVTRYCSTGLDGSEISASGSADFGVNGGSGDLALHATDAQPNGFGIFYYGLAQTVLPFGDGFRCIVGGFRMPLVAIDGAGAASFAVDYLNPLNPVGQISPLSTWNFQFWYRNGAGSFDLTDAIEIEFGGPFFFGPGQTIVMETQSAHPLATPGGVALITDAASWADFWTQHMAFQFPPDPVPPVDFTTSDVVAVFAGWQPTSGYDIEITELNLSVATLDVTSNQQQPGSGCGLLQVITYPHHFVTVPKVQHLTLGTWDQMLTATCP